MMILLNLKESKWTRQIW